MENVAAIRSRGLYRVFRDLAQVGYNACWTSLRASGIGAAHRRERVFILAYRPEATGLLTAAYARGKRWERWPAYSQTTRGWASGGSIRLSDLALAGASVKRIEPPRTSASSVGELAWGRYEAAIRRWEALTGRAAPYPVERGTRGQPRLAADFSEWLMGLPRGFVTDLGLPYGAQHRALDNGVVPLQAMTALWRLVAMAIGPQAARNKTRELGMAA